MFLTITITLLLLSASNAVIDDETIRRKLNGEPLYEIVARTEEEYDSMPLIELQFPKIEQHTSNTNLVLLNEITFSSLRCQPDACSGDKCTCKAGFCRTNLDTNEKPENYPTFNQVTDSDYCHAQQKMFELNDIYAEKQNYDQQQGINPVPVELVVFDMGNTKASERFGVPLKLALPTKKIVSNAQPLAEAIKMCDDVKNRLTRKGSCNKKAVLDLYNKVVNLLCNDSNPNIDGCILILNPSASDSLDYLDIGDDTPVAYVYGPSELIVSNYPVDIDRASCNKFKKNKPEKRINYIHKKGYNDDTIVPSSVNCAAAAASNMEEVNKALKSKAKGKHYAINTLDLPYALKQVMQDVFDVTDLTDDIKRDMVEKSNKDIYGVPFNKFLQYKKENMDIGMKNVVKEFMEDLYDELELEEIDNGDNEFGERKLTTRKKVRMTDWV